MFGPAGCARPSIPDIAAATTPPAELRPRCDCCAPARASTQDPRSATDYVAGARCRTASARCVTGTYTGPGPGCPAGARRQKTTHCYRPRCRSALPPAWQTREQTSAFHGGDVQSRRAGLVVSPIRVVLAKGDPHDLTLGAQGRDGPAAVSVFPEGSAGRRGARPSRPTPTSSTSTSWTEATTLRPGRSRTSHDLDPCCLQVACAKEAS